MYENLVKTILSEFNGIIQPIYIVNEDSKGTGLCNASLTYYDNKLHMILRNVEYTLHTCEGQQKYQSCFEGPLSYYHKDDDLNLRTTVKLPNGSGKKLRVAVLCESDKIDEAKKSGAEVFGSDDLIQKIASGKLDFTKLICTPAMMGKIGKHGKVLGPKGLMPNPKLGTVSNDITKSVNEIKTGLVEIRNDKDGNLASSIGRKSYSTEKLLENYNHFIESVKKEKPDTIKGELIKNIFITSTMGISYKVGAK